MNDKAVAGIAAAGVAAAALLAGQVGGTKRRAGGGNVGKGKRCTFTNWGSRCVLRAGHKGDHKRIPAGGRSYP